MSLDNESESFTKPIINCCLWQLHLMIHLKLATWRVWSSKFDSSWFYINYLILKMPLLWNICNISRFAAFDSYSHFYLEDIEDQMVCWVTAFVWNDLGCFKSFITLHILECNKNTGKYLACSFTYTHWWFLKTGIPRLQRSILVFPFELTFTRLIPQQHFWYRFI